MLTPGQIIVLATPVFLGLMALEFAWGWHKKRNTYHLADAISSVGLGMFSQLTGAFLTPIFTVAIYVFIQSHLNLLPQSETFWLSPAGWFIALLFYDFCYYWLHRKGHEMAVLWAAHVVHHQSQDYNLSTALRQPVTYPLLAWVFYVPMAVLGVPPIVFAVVGMIDLLYQFWIHTEHVPKLGWFDRVFASPSNHRVHHAVNDRYVDKNYGGILILWDRLFGTFEDEDLSEPCVYGTRSPLNSWDPIWANAEVYAALAQDSWHARSWADKLKTWLKPPGWRPADVAERFPKPGFDIESVQRYSPAISRPVQWLSCVGFTAILVGVLVFLWNAHLWSLPVQLAGLVFLSAALWVIGAVMQGRLVNPTGAGTTAG